jgi:hypothetical protein
VAGRPFGHGSVSRDGVAFRRGGVYHGGILLASGDGASTVSIYDGVDANGELIDYFSALTSAADRHVFETGVRIREGLYVDVGSNVSKLTIFYEPPEGADI